MISTKLEDYEVLSILGTDVVNSTCYKVKCKKNGKFFLWKAISYRNLEEINRLALIENIKRNKSQNRPRVLRVYDYIVEEDAKLLYLIIEYCKNGNLTGLIYRCLMENEHLDEGFLWKLLYQIACFMKHENASITAIFNLNNIFLDENYNVKLFDRAILEPTIDRDKFTKIVIGSILLELCMLKPIKEECFHNLSFLKNILLSVPHYYSEELKEMIRFTFKSYEETESLVGAILCHPTVLLRSRQPNTNLIFRKNSTINYSPHVKDNEKNEDIEIQKNQSRLQSIRNREIELKRTEERLAIKEYELCKREKKISLMEKSISEKILRAELYLKRCRAYNNRANFRSNSYDSIDTSFSAGCDDSTVNNFTSEKLITKNIKRPSNFTRTLSNRRVKFKAHSPLKDVHNTVGNSSTSRSRLTCVQETTTASESDKSSVTTLFKFSDGTGRRSMKKLSLSSIKIDPQKVIEKVKSTTNKETEIITKDRGSTSWNEEIKQRAFHLLRIMNEAKDSEPIKHTYL